MGAYAPGQIVLVDWRRDALPREANKLRPCIVIEDGDLFDDSFPNVIVVPIADQGDVAFVIPSLCVRIEPTAENGCAKPSYAVAHSVVTASKERVKRATPSRVTAEQLADIRALVAESIGGL